MPEIDFEQIKKLPPDQRVKVLQELQNQIEKLINDRKKEIEQAHELLARAKDELRVLEEVQTPKVKQLTVEELFKTNDKDDDKKQGLENIAQKNIPSPEIIRQHFEQKPIAEIYKRINDVTADIRNSGIITQYQENFLRAANYEMQDREKAIENRQYRPTEKAQHLLSTAEKIISQYIN